GTAMWTVMESAPALTTPRGAGWAVPARHASRLPAVVTATTAITTPRAAGRDRARPPTFLRRDNGPQYDNLARRDGRTGANPGAPFGRAAAVPPNARSPSGATRVG